MAERYDDLRKSRSKRPKYKEVTIPNLVATGYTAFVAAQKKLEKKEEAKKKRVAAKKVTQAVAAAPVPAASGGRASGGRPDRVAKRDSS